MKKLLLGITCMLMVLGLIFSAECGKQPTSPASDRLEVRNNGTAIQWKYSDETDWHDLVALDELRGAAGENGKDGKDGADGKNGKDGINGTKSKDGINGFDGKDGADGKNGKDGIDGINGKDGIDGKSIEVQRAGTHIQWCYEGDEWQNLVAISDITGPAGQNGKDGANGKTPEFRVNKNTLQWRYVGDEIWLNLYELTALKGADGKDGTDGKDGINGKDGIDGKDGINGKDGIDGANGKDGRDGKDGINGKDGSCAGYFAANGRVYSWGTPLPFNVKKESGDLISYNSSSKTITLSKGHTYSMVFSGTVMISANGNYKLCGASLIDGYNSSEMMLETRTYVSMIDDGQSARLGMSYNTIYRAESDIALTFQYTNMLFQNTDFTDSQYNITIIALD